MTMPTPNETKRGLVQDMRKIRDQVSAEINDMTFEQERAYLDKLLAARKQSDALPEPLPPRK